MSFRLSSPQKMVDEDFYLVFKEIYGEVVIKGTTNTGHMQQIGLMNLARVVSI